MNRVRSSTEALFTAGILALASSLEAMAAGPSQCQKEVKAFCPGASESDIAVYDCLEGKLGSLSPACREAVLAANPVLRSELNYRADCSAEIPKLCPGNLKGLSLAGCLESKYESASEKCLKRLIAENGAFQQTIDKKKREAEEAAQAAQKAAQVKKQQEQAHEAAVEVERKQEVSEERRSERYAACRKRLLKEFKDPTHPALDGFCGDYSKIPEPNDEQSACMKEMIKAVPSAFKIKESQKVGAESAAWAFCEKNSGNAEYRACARKVLSQGEEFYLAVSLCDPLFIRCANEFGGASTGPRKAFIRALCLSNAEYYMTADECAEKQAEYWMGFFKQPRNGPLVKEQFESDRTKCASYLEPARVRLKCYNELSKRHPILVKEDYVKMLQDFCQKSDVYAECVIERFFKLPAHIQAVGWPNPTQRELGEIDKVCTVKAGLDATASGASNSTKQDCPK